MRKLAYTTLSRDQLESLLARSSPGPAECMPAVREVFERIAREGDDAIRFFTQKFDGVAQGDLFASDDEFEEADRLVDPGFKRAIVHAASNIEKFHRAQFPASIEVTTSPGVTCRREWRPLDPVGLYVPGGSAPLVSTLLMLAVPARIAGCRDVIVSTPPQRSGKISAEILWTASHAGIRRILKAGGAQAVAALALGTGTVPKVKKIFGPGNRFVVAAKLLASQSPYSVAIDMPAGPSELLIVADSSANPAWIAADLLSQAEHGEDSEVFLVSTSDVLADEVQKAVAAQIILLPRRAIAEKVLDRSVALIIPSLSDAMCFSNDYAPEHLMLAVREPEALIPSVKNAGSVFLGNSSAVAFGDYASGTNHTLPTRGAAAQWGGLVTESFMKPVLFQSVSNEGLRSLAATSKALASAEGLMAHARAVEIREKL